MLSTLRTFVVGTALALGLGAAPAFAQITTVATTISGTTQALNFSVSVSPESRFLGQGKLYFVLLHNGQFYLLSETRGFVPYTGGEIPEYRTIRQPTETIAVNNWNTRAQLGAAVFVGYGSDFWEMLNSGRYRQVATLAEYPIPPGGSDPYAAYSGTYLCTSDTGASYNASATVTASQAVVDTSRITAIPVPSISLPFDGLGSSGDRLYANRGFPLYLVSLDTAANARYPLALAYQASDYSASYTYLCTRR
ncbi:hypothetical protein HNP48_006898 [Acidovorax soli]|uniref:Uncharacterized protein n=1 Tax=Acidovorax soli TaxID=592050 RepID=A0A7X0PMI3_9BURK|nr:hypothetical protein [Acidovorax soli]MBB6564171.1 hypothetical protein [Acidovorax soli]